jgi:RNA polymerase sigma factor (sigma-70 family)
MSAAAIRGVVRRLGPSTSSTDSPTDSDLVAAFAAGHDPDAFAALVNRHGPTVLGVCRRVLGNVHDAEDAFQAVFLVLARKVKAVRPPGAVGGWLYGVAVRTANKARVAMARRRRREMIAATNSTSRGGKRQPEDSRVEAELRAALDEEIGKLPDPLRAVVVLCDLHGRTRAEAATELRSPEGTIAARLHRARKKLGEALARRGLALPAAGLTTLLVPVTVSATAARSAVAAALGSASPAVLALAREVTRSMASTSYALALGVISLLAGGLLAAGNLHSSDPPNTPQAQPPQVELKVDQPRSSTPWKESKVLEMDGWLAGSVVYSGDGNVLFLGGTSGGGHVRAFSTSGFELLWEYKGLDQFSALALSPDGQTLAVTVKDGIQFLDARTGKAGDKLEEAGSEPSTTAYFPDVTVQAGGDSFTSRKLIFGNARGYYVKSWLAWPQVGTIKSSIVPDGKEPPDAHAAPLAVSPDGKRVVVTGPIDRDTGKNVLWAWSAGSGEANKLLEGHKSVVTCATWSKDGKTILTGDAEGIVIAWDGETFKEKSRRRFGPRIAAVAISPDGEHHAAAVASLMPAPNKTEAYTEMVFVCPSVNPPENLKPLFSHDAGGPFKGVASLAFAPDGKSLAVAFANFSHLTRLGELVGKVRIFSVADEPPAKKPAPAAVEPGKWTEKAVLTHHAGPVDSVAIAPDGRTFVSGGADGKVLLWNTATLEPRELGAVVPAGKFTAVAFSPNGKLVAATRDKVTGFFDPEKLQPVLMNPPFRGGRGVAFSPDGKWVATSDGYTTGFRGLEGGEAYGARPGSLGGQLPAPVAWSADSRYLASIEPLESGHWRVGIMGVLPNSKARNLDDHMCEVHAVAWSKDGKLIASAGEDGTVILWDGQTFQELRQARLLGRTRGPTRYHCLTFSPDGRTLAAAITLGSGKSVHRVILLDTDTLEQGEHLFPPAHYPIRSVAFSPNGKLLIAACGINRADLKAQMTPDELKEAGSIVVWERTAVQPEGNLPARLENAELKKFQGAWKIDGFELGGGNKLSPEEVKGLGWTLTIEGNKFRFAGKDGKAGSSGRIAVDSSQVPPVLVRIETDREQDVYTWCLYEVDGDTLRLCQDVRGKGRPKEFKATADTTIATYKRIEK